MRKVMNIVLGGLQQKIFNLVLVTIILVIAAYSAVLMYQSRHIRDLVAESNDEQRMAVEQISSMTMEAVVQSSQVGTARLQAQIIETAFADLKEVVEILESNTQEVFASPEDHEGYAVERPDASRDGELTLQLLSEKGVDLEDPEIQEKAELIGGLSDIMLTLFKSGRVDSCFVGTPDGLFVIADDRSAKKFRKDGELIAFPVTKRVWYTGAVETGGIYFTDLEYDAFSGALGVVCSCPVYVDGELVAVVGADLFQKTEGTVETDADANSIIFVVNQDGHVIYSQMESGPFAMRVSDRAWDLRESSEPELAEYVKKALKDNTDAELIQVGDKSYYMTGAKLNTVGWSLIYALDQEITEQPTRTMQEQIDSIHATSLAKVNAGIQQSGRMIQILLLLVLIAASVAALSLAKKIVGPLNTMTKKLTGLSDTNRQFMMEDIYRTGDEIEVLAESFADLSAKTLRYIHEVATVTAENERISTELDMAKSIQASQLPSIFPAYPSRPDFDIYASMTPAREVGGDFYDFFLVDDDHLCMVIADVSGKGVPAALFMMISKILIKNRIQSGETPGVALHNVNNQLLEGAETDMFVTVWLCVFEISTGKGIVANAGHEHPAVRRANGEYELIKYRHAPAVGMMDDLQFPEHEFTLHPGDSLFVYTDGVTEASNSGHELYGTDRMVETLNRHPDADPMGVLHGMLDDIVAFEAGAEQFDDITMMCLKYIG